MRIIVPLLAVLMVAFFTIEIYSTRHPHPRTHEFPKVEWPPFGDGARQSVYDHAEQRYEVRPSDAGALLRFNFAGPHWALLPASPGAGFSLDIENFSEEPLSLPIYGIPQMLTIQRACTLVFDGRIYQLAACQGDSHGQ